MPVEFCLLLLPPRDTLADLEPLELFDVALLLFLEPPDRFACDLVLLLRPMLLRLFDLLVVALWLLREDELLILPVDLFVLR